MPTFCGSPRIRVSAGIGYAESIVGGQKPYVRATYDLGKGVTYRMIWNYYGCNGKGQASNAIAGLARFRHRDFNGSTVEFALRYAF